MDAAEILEESVVAGCTVYNYTANGGSVRHVAAYALNRRDSSRTVHLVRYTDADRDGWRAGRPRETVCRGPQVGDPRPGGLADGEHFCSSCLWGLEREAWRDKYLRPARGGEYADWLTAGQAKAHVLHRADGLAEVALNVPVPLLVSLIRDVPGRRYDRDLHAWLIPDAWSADLTASLAGAGVEVRETPVMS